MFRIETLDISNNNIYFSVFERISSVYNIAKILEDNVANLTYETQNQINDAESITIAEGDNTTLTISGLTSTNNTYQWYKNNEIIAGATNESYEITNASGINSGDYICFVNNSDVPNLTLQRNPITVNVTVFH